MIAEKELIMITLTEHRASVGDRLVVERTYLVETMPQAEALNEKCLWPLVKTLMYENFEASSWSSFFENELVREKIYLFPQPIALH